jgi:hypothetical protein
MPRVLAPIVIAAYLLVIVLLLAGCSGQPTLFPNSEPSLRKSTRQFSTDAAPRHPFKYELPTAGVAQGRAQVGYGVNFVEVVNLSTEDWNDVEIWVNRTHVVHMPKIQAGRGRTTSIAFHMLFDANGHHFPIDNSRRERMVRQLEMVRDGQVYTIPFRQAD